MEERDYTGKRTQLGELDQSLARPWALPSIERITFYNRIATPDKVLTALIHARQAFELGESYRDFQVGACAEVNRDDGASMVIKHGANFKDAPGESAIDDHAEQLVLEDLQPGDTISVIAIVGWPQPDHGSGKESSTLHPCFKCRGLFVDSEQVTPTTLIICATPDMKEIEWGTLDDFIAFHEDRPNNLQRVSFDETPALFEPVEPNHPYGIVLNDEMEIDTSEWDARMTVPIGEWMYAVLSRHLSEEK